MSFFDEIDNFDEDLINQFPGQGTSSSSSPRPRTPTPWGNLGICNDLFLYQQRNDGVNINESSRYGARYVFYDGFIGINFRIYEGIRFSALGGCPIKTYEVSVNDIDDKEIKTSVEVVKSTDDPQSYANYFAHGQYWSSIWSFTIGLKDQDQILKSLACKCYRDQQYCASQPKNYVKLQIQDEYYYGLEIFYWTIPMWGWGMSNEMIQLIKSYNRDFYNKDSIWRFDPSTECPQLNTFKKNQTINFNKQKQNYLL